MELFNLKKGKEVKLYQKKALEVGVKSYELMERHMPMFIVTVIFLMLSGNLHAKGDAADYLVTLKPGVTKTFGHGSTFEWLAYIGEAGMCIWRYVSTQNVAWFFGMPIIMAFTYAFLD